MVVMINPVLELFACTGCSEAKPSGAFRYKKGARVGRCRKCEAAYTQHWRSTQDRSEYLRRKREGMARQRQLKPEHVRSLGRNWHANNRARSREKMREYYARRFFWGRAVNLVGEGRATFRELAAMWKRQRGRCALTLRRLDRNAQLDHILPKARGGTDELGNLRWVCAEVNLAKRHLTDDEFVTLCREVVNVAM
jgi:hypothetical protein